MARSVDNFDEWLSQLKNIIVDGCDEAVQKTAIEGANLIRGRVPGNRRKTRTAMRHRVVDDNRAEIGMFFSEVYPTTSTSDSRVIFRQEWERARPILIERMVERLNRKFN